MVQYDWKFELCHSYGDMPAIGELTQARSKQFQKTLNRSGNLSFNVPLSYDLAHEIETIATCVRASKNGKPVWSGPVWQTDEKSSASESKMVVNCVGWYEFANVRYFRTNVNYPAPGGTEDAQVAFDIINNHANESSLVIPSGVIDGEIVYAPASVWFTAGSRRSDLTDFPYVPVLRGSGNLSYQAWANNLGQSIQTLSDLEGGFDWEIDPMTRAFDVWRKKCRQTDAVFAAEWGPKNLSEAGRQTDASQMRNFFNVSGKTVGSGIVYNDGSDPAHPPTHPRYGYFEEPISLSNVNDPAILGAYGNAELALRERPIVTHSITPFPLGTNENVPSIFEDYDIGDICGLVVKDGRFDVGSDEDPQSFRLFGATVNISDEGNETVSAMQIYYG
jgi:hypothetical protein